MKNVFYKVLDGFFSICNRIIKFPLLILAILVAVAIAFLVLMMHNKANVGGILGKLLSLLGVGSDQTKIEQSNTIPVDRKQALEQADARGYTQHKVSELDTSSNPFRDKTIVQLPSGRKVKLPDGIKDTDVDSIIEAESEVQIIPKQENYAQAVETQQAINKAQSANQKAQDLLAKLKARQ